MTMRLREINAIASLASEICLTMHYLKYNTTPGCGIGICWRYSNNQLIFVVLFSNLGLINFVCHVWNIRNKELNNLYHVGFKFDGRKFS